MEGGGRPGTDRYHWSSVNYEGGGLWGRRKIQGRVIRLDDRRKEAWGSLHTEKCGGSREVRQRGRKRRAVRRPGIS